MNFLTALAVFGVIFPAELPDKTMVAGLVLGTRFRPGLVWCGMALAFATHVAIAVTAGGLLSLAPRWLVGSIAATLFLIGAIVLVREPSESQQEADESAEIDRIAGREQLSPVRVIGTGYVVVFVAEWGDLTQILTATLAARYHDPVSVAVGAVVALWAVAAISVVAGRTLLRIVPINVVRRIAASVLLLLAVITLIETFA